MKLAIFSDSHDHLHHISAALKIVQERGITIGLHLGDFCAPPAFALLSESDMQWYGVWGNVDGDKLGAWLRVKDKGNVDIGTNDFRELELGGRKLFLTHYPEIARIAALSGQYDAAFHGHNHEAKTEVVAQNNHETLLANPGELCGFRFGVPTFGIYDTESNTLEHVTLNP